MSTDLPASAPSPPSGATRPRQQDQPGSTPVDLPGDPSSSPADDLPDDALPDDVLPDDVLPDDVAALTYEQAREELVTVVTRLEAGSVPLEDSLALWERGEALARRCQSWLDQARARLAAVEQHDQPAE